MLQALAEIFLVGEHKISNRFHLQGFEFSYKQSSRQEYNYQVQNVAVDLRDGIRLSKLVELVTGDSGFSDVSICHS
jgi:abnormal spindle-like microcephaly-associated protein